MPEDRAVSVEARAHFLLHALHHLQELCGKENRRSGGPSRRGSPAPGAQCQGASEARPGLGPRGGGALAFSDKLHKTRGRSLPATRRNLVRLRPAPPTRLSCVGAGCKGAPPPTLPAGSNRGSPLSRLPTLSPPSPSKSMRPSLFLSPSFIRDSISSSVTCSPEALKISASSSASM